MIGPYGSATRARKGWEPGENAGSASISVPTLRMAVSAPGASGCAVFAHLRKECFGDVPGSGSGVSREAFCGPAERRAGAGRSAAAM
ncbi:hypothetical protein [Actinomadura rubrisoli]|uniref:Uncharacterized protein n=1 Tax=Actinomadura rubrisoli TaxID=2530368 RepID=A0A4R4ZI11_9ACTN|nr:hypothetical protein [Actinomadura rubrisoli]TDD58308.1 hypothetical protein E1298_47185 [Actinomadura rubrisoli]